MSDRPKGPKYGTIDRDYAIRMATAAPEDDGPIWMLNLMRYREVAEYRDGRESAISGQEADDAYAPTDVLRDIGAEIVLFGDVIDQPIGDTPRWDRIAVVRYPTRRSFIEMQTRSDFKEKHEHKEAGMAETIVMGTLPLGPAAAEARGRQPGSVLVLHVESHAEGAEPVTVPVAPGAHDAGRFTVEGTIVGDGRAWTRVRYDLFPDPEGASAPAAPGAVDAYAIVIRPRINRIAGSTD